MNNDPLTLDAFPSARRVDENGFLHVAASHITKAGVNPYYGREIPGWQEAGLEPDRIYHGLREAGELRASLSTWEGLPLHIRHHADSADQPARETRVGAVGAVRWNEPYIDAVLTVWDRAAIRAIEAGAFRQLSCAYRYEPDFTPGVHGGTSYDFVMRKIRGNHVALVEEGRAGPDVLVADGKPLFPPLSPQDGARASSDRQAGERAGANRADKAGGIMKRAFRQLFARDAAEAASTPEPPDSLETPASRKRQEKNLEPAEAPDALNALVARVLDAVPDLRPEQSEALAAVLGEAMAEPLETSVPPAESAPADVEAMAQDVGPSAVRRQAMKEARRHFCVLSEALRAVRPLVGDLDPLAFDSAEAVYGYALEQRGLRAAEYAPSAWRGMVDVLRLQKEERIPPVSGSLAGAFAGLNRISLAD